MKYAFVPGVAALGLFQVSGTATVYAQPVGPADPWFGWYAGVHGGYRWADVDFSSAPYLFTPPGFPGPVLIPGRNESFDLDSGILGVHVGRNFDRKGSKYLFGVEGDWTWGWGDDGSSATLVFVNPNTSAIPPSVTFARTTDLELEWQATIRGRAGVVRGNWLYYGTVGIAFIHLEWRERITGAGLSLSHSSDDTEVGVVIGGGAEMLYDENWRFRIEYLYEWFGDVSVPHGLTTPPQIGKLDDLDVHKIRIGISRKLNFN